MKIACISDIHGNKLALDNVLEDIKKEGATKILVLGDLAMGGYDPNYTIEKIFSLENVDIIQGNTDELIVNYSDEMYNSMHPKNPLMAGALKLDVVEIKEKNKELLKNLPENKVVDIDGIKILMAHGSPRRQDENIFADTPLNEVEEMVKNSPCDLIFVGHTHIPCGFSLESGKTVVTVGSVGRSMTKDKMPIYLLMTVNSDGSFSFEHKKVKYDNKKVAEIIKNRNFKESLDFSKLYL